MELTEQTKLEDVIAPDGVTIVDYYATWCGPCKMMKPILDAIEASGQAKVIKVDTEVHTELAILFGIKSLPTFMFYKNGTLLNDHTRTGAIPKPVLEKLIDIIENG